MQNNEYIINKKITLTIKIQKEKRKKKNILLNVVLQ